MSNVKGFGVSDSLVGRGTDHQSGDGGSDSRSGRGIFRVGKFLEFPGHSVSLCLPHNIQIHTLEVGIESSQLITVEVQLEH